ncbi:OstA-like protein [Rubricoccus marinus]|uniref:Organic solvent tolerance-like N-terminal domain-containing protein n=1 Tax=Rubricoccus marinus TaxID=716817 RepID=A0A259TZY8_9BACT|nr:OstA-like protein [Rubricoccus marinus]OZC03260.1 hypothetical protein BSZ36_09890 [Rubricoccus marinus]
MMHWTMETGGLWRNRWASGARGLAVLLALLVSALAPEAQTRTIEVLSADQSVSESDSTTGRVERLTGSVELRSDTTTIRADRATLYDRRRVLLSGRVRIVAGDDTLTARDVEYDAQTKLAVAKGDVRIGADGGVLFAPEVTYNSRDKRAAFSGGGRILQDGAEITSPSGTYETERRFATLTGPLAITDSSGVLTAARGTYAARAQRADVVGTVRLVRERDRLDADSLVYFRRTERARAFGQVVLDRLGGEAPEDSLRRFVLFGSALIYDGQAETAEMTAGDGLVLLASLEQDAEGRVDTTLVRASGVRAARETEGETRTERLVARGGARLWREGLGAAADSAVFVRTAPVDTLDATPPRDRLDLIGGYAGPAPEAAGASGDERPTVWLRGSQLTADSLWIVSGALRDSVFARTRAFAGKLDSTLGRVQQLAGGRMLGIVLDDQLRRLHVSTAAEAMVYQATSDGLLDSAIRLGSDSLVFRFDAGGEIRRLDGKRVTAGIEGTLYPGALVPAVQLPGFTFTPEEQPTREALLTGWEAAWLLSHPDWNAPPETLPADAPPAEDSGETEPAPLAPEASAEVETSAEDAE